MEPTQENILMLVKHTGDPTPFALDRLEGKWNETMVHPCNFSHFLSWGAMYVSLKVPRIPSPAHGFQKPKGLYQKHYRFISIAICLYKSLLFRNMWLPAWPCRKSVYLPRTSSFSTPSGRSVVSVLGLLPWIRQTVLVFILELRKQRDLPTQWSKNT